MRLPQQPPPLQKSSRFKRLLQQLNECHEEELSRATQQRLQDLDQEIRAADFQAPSSNSFFTQSPKLPNTVADPGKDPEDWGVRVREVQERTHHEGLALEDASPTTVKSPFSAPTKHGPPSSPSPILTEAPPATLKLRGDLDVDPAGDSESEMIGEDEVSPMRSSIATDHSSKSRLGSDRFPLRRLWASESKVQQVRPTRRQTSKSKLDSDDASSSAVGKESSDSSALDFFKSLTWRSFISYPSSLTRLAWDMFGGMLIMYDLFAVPLQAFNPPQTTPLVVMDWLTLIFWTVNVGMSLTTGYVEEGITIMEPRKIVKRYLKTWFVVDLVVLVPDWVFTIIASDANSEAVAIRLTRVVRLARVVRLLRLVRLKRLFEQIEDALDSEYYSVLFNIFKMMLLLFTVNHVIACGWFALADANSNSGLNTWTKEWLMTDFPWEHLYLVSLHWSLTQFTPAGMDVTPTNEIERGFTIGVVVFALVGFAYVVGSITASLGQLRTMSEEASKDFWQMRRFLNQNSVDHNLAARIQRFVEYAYSRQQKTMSINQVKVLSLLSKQLMEELQCAINLPHMKVHPLFMFLNEFSFITMNRCAKESISHMEMAQGDTLFLPEQHAFCMYFVAFGRLEYIRITDNAGNEFKEFVDKGEDWLAEPALWTESWYHVGEAKAYTDCEVLLVDPKAFEEILNVVRPVASIVANYCRRFMSWLQNLESEEGMLTDVIQGDQVSDTIQSFLPMWMVEKPDDAVGKVESTGDLLKASRWSWTAWRKARMSLRR